MKASPELSEYAEFAGQLADQAGEIARRYFKTGLRVEQKADDSPVTIADREIEAMVCNAIREAYPDHGILGEEQAAYRLDADWLWVIDPIDGTRAFIAGQATFVTLIALCYQGVPMIGLIDQPIVEERWIGIEGQQTLFNGKPVPVRPCANLSAAWIATTSMPYFTSEERAMYEQLAMQCAKQLPGEDGYSYGLVARGEMDIVIDAKLKPYDFCALVPVVEGAGGYIRDWEGSPLNIRSVGRAICCGNIILFNSIKANSNLFI